MQGEPTYAALQGETVFLTKDAQGQLWLPIAQGSQSLLVQHRQSFRRALGLATASLELPRLAVPATSTRVEVRYPQDWVPLYEGFLSEGRLWAPDGGEVVGWALLAFWAERVGLLLGLGLRRRLVIAMVTALAAVLSARCSPSCSSPCWRPLPCGRSASCAGRLGRRAWPCSASSGS